GVVGCRSRSKPEAISRILRGVATTRCAQSAPSLRVRPKTRVCGVAFLLILSISPSSRSLHPSRCGPNALHVGLVQRFPKAEGERRLPSRVSGHQPTRNEGK